MARGEVLHRNVGAPVKGQDLGISGRCGKGIGVLSGFAGNGHVVHIVDGQLLAVENLIPGVIFSVRAHVRRALIQERRVQNDLFVGTDGGQEFLHIGDGDLFLRLGGCHHLRFQAAQHLSQLHLQQLSAVVSQNLRVPHLGEPLPALVSLAGAANEGDGAVRAGVPFLGGILRAGDKAAAIQGVIAQGAVLQRHLCPRVDHQVLALVIRNGTFFQGHIPGSKDIQRRVARILGILPYGIDLAVFQLHLVTVVEGYSRAGAGIDIRVLHLESCGAVGHDAPVAAAVKSQAPKGHILALPEQQHIPFARPCLLGVTGAEILQGQALAVLKGQDHRRPGAGFQYGFLGVHPPDGQVVRIGHHQLDPVRGGLPAAIGGILQIAFSHINGQLSKLHHRPGGNGRGQCAAVGDHGFLLGGKYRLGAVSQRQSRHAFRTCRAAGQKGGAQQQAQSISIEFTHSNHPFHEGCD